MEMDAILNILFAAVISGLGWWIKTQKEEIDRVRVLLNKTREESAQTLAAIAKEYVTKSDSSQVLNQIMNKFDRIEEKIDRLMEK
jgi:Tfp pilus assembly protein PilO|tara:strand:+ start:1092 stop:1346 length:255 start_codon:yes stop_codon:yes gene_type:complete